MRTDDPIPDLKRAVAARILEELEGYSLQFAAGMIDADRWRVADLRAGRLDRFSLETLIRYAANARLETALTLTRS